MTNSPVTMPNTKESHQELHHGLVQGGGGSCARAVRCLTTSGSTSRSTTQRIHDRKQIHDRELLRTAGELLRSYSAREESS